MITKENAQEVASKYLSEGRLNHSKRVAEMAVKMALKWDVDPDKAYLAGILHDIAKELPKEEQIELAKGANPPIDSETLKIPSVIHGLSGAKMVKDLGINDNDILEAIYYHSLAKPNLCKLGQIIYISDLLEEGRNFLGIDEMRKMAYNNLDLCMVMCLTNVGDYLMSSNKPVHSLSNKALEFFKNKVENSNK